MERTVPFLNICISFVTFITAVSLVVYMLVAFVTGTYDVALQIFDTIFLEPAERQSIFNALNVEFLHTIALLIVLMKAYRILVEYMRWYHVDIKYMMEIGIIASVLELLFNYQSYSPDMRYIFLGIAVSFAAIYAFRHDTLVKAMRESRRENHEWLCDDHETVLETNALGKSEPTAVPEDELPAPRTRTAKKVTKKAVKKTTRKVARKRTTRS
ncbi:MAG TPA: hypothetical protein VKP88_07780 [Candidatus Paceibacterota bacterium]|nr:hypothetical protein [Candidatus Paceibacterota bacterium]